ncbi:predicted protein [Histoplasma capsulatum G186AR]|uniref:Uncharacterized protein n=1 Tax=Ajellomyces capsulatus (strain G186AR / H82 / ATCC MYA-2454 / RMSCC 2432) TaxID=447093 RepID=C0NVL1_AJECG|nr:uncharacterized protein HCBG_07191 [Histoplasma capsulatum G186AR]EEH04550.1 predicted protein [Histoplasma capsulatum G186AR]
MSPENSTRPRTSHEAATTYIMIDSSYRFENDRKHGGGHLSISALASGTAGGGAGWLASWTAIHEDLVRNVVLVPPSNAATWNWSKVAAPLERGMTYCFSCAVSDLRFHTWNVRVRLGLQIRDDGVDGFEGIIVVGYQSCS